MIYNRSNQTKEKKEQACSTMKRHVYGTAPETIFKERHPLESKDEYAIEYRKRNFRNNTVSYFQQAINDINLVLVNNPPNVVWSDTTEIQAYIKQIKFITKNNRLNLWDWFVKKVLSEYIVDANAYLVILPKHPKTPFPKRYTETLPNFNQIINQKIEVEVKIIPTSSIVEEKDNYIKFRAGEYEIRNGILQPYYIILSAEKTEVELPNKDGKYEKHLYYLNNLQYKPYVVLGNIEVKNENEECYHISELYGSALIADMLIGQTSDLQIAMKRFTYPRHFMHEYECPNGCEYSEEKKCHIDIKTGSTCSSCGGAGYTRETSVLGSRVIPVKRGMEETTELKIPEAFISPPTDGTRLSFEYCNYLEDKLIASLCILNQNMTNQSGVSKSYDLQQKISRNARIVTHLLTLYEIVINTISEYLNGSSNNHVVLPEEYDIFDIDDIAAEIANAKANNLPDAALTELTKKYLLKKYGKNAINEKIVNYLSIYDRFFNLSQNEKAQTKALYSNTISNTELLHSQLSWSILQAYAQESPNKLLKLTNQEIYNYVIENIKNIYPETESPIIS